MKGYVVLPSCPCKQKKVFTEIIQYLNSMGATYKQIDNQISFVLPDSASTEGLSKFNPIYDTGPSDDLPPFPHESQLPGLDAQMAPQPWGRVFALAAFCIGMSAAHWMGYFHHHVLNASMLLCAMLCSACMLYFGWGDYMKPLLKELGKAWPSLLIMTAGVCLGLNTVWLFMPWLMLRALLSDCGKGRRYDVLFAAALLLPMPWTCLSLAVPVYAMVKDIYRRADHANANVGVALTLVSTFILSWASVLFPGVMHAWGIHVFFHDALILLAVFEWGRVLRDTVSEHARVWLAKHHAIHVWRQGAWVAVAVQDVSDNDVMLASDGHMMTHQVKVLAVQEGCQYLPVMNHQEKFRSLNVGDVLSTGAQIHGADCLVQRQSMAQDCRQEMPGHQAYKAPVVPAWFSAGVIVFATVLGILCAYLHPTLVLQVVSSVLMAACPCIFTVAEPFIQQLFVLYAGQMGVAVRKVPDLWNHVRTVVFDRTGTLAHPVKRGDKAEYQLDRELNSFKKCVNKSGIQVMCLTAQSRASRIQPLTDVLGESHVFFGGEYDSAESKGDKVNEIAQQYGSVMMVGDNINDQIALRNAAHSLAMLGHTDVVGEADAASSPSDKYDYIRLLVSASELLGVLRTTAVIYNVAVMMLVGVYPLCSGALLLSPAMSCVMMSIGSLFQLLGAGIGMEIQLARIGRKDLSLTQRCWGHLCDMSEKMTDSKAMRAVNEGVQSMKEAYSRLASNPCK